MILTFVGARPQFIKAAPLSRALKAAGQEEVLIHSGQHFDNDMSQIFFDELQIPQPDINLSVGSGPQGWQTGRMLELFEKTLLQFKPDAVLLHGDTNSTLAGALAAVKLHIPLIHNEAGLRSFNRSMPEEHNRVLTDHCADLLFCPTQLAVDQLRQEGISSGVHLTGDVMYDALIFNLGIAQARSKILESLKLIRKGYLLATLHRPYNVDYKERLSHLLAVFSNIQETIVLPVHPRTRERMDEFKLRLPDNVVGIDPVGYLDMLALEDNARIILTDSGGVQKEAYIQGVPCLTLRSETEWVETVEAGWNMVVDRDENLIRKGVTEHWWPERREQIYGDGHAAEKIVKIILDFLKEKNLSLDT